MQALILTLLMTLEGPVYMLQLLEGEHRERRKSRKKTKTILSSLLPHCKKMSLSLIETWNVSIFFSTRVQTSTERTVLAGLLHFLEWLDGDFVHFFNHIWTMCWSLFVFPGPLCTMLPPTVTTSACLLWWAPGPASMTWTNAAALHYTMLLPPTQTES